LFIRKDVDKKSNRTDDRKDAVDYLHGKCRSRYFINSTIASAAWTARPGSRLICMSGVDAGPRAQACTTVAWLPRTGETGRTNLAKERTARCRCISSVR